MSFIRETPLTTVFGPMVSNGVFPLKEGDPDSPYNAFFPIKEDSPLSIIPVRSDFSLKEGDPDSPYNAFFPIKEDSPLSIIYEPVRTDFSLKEADPYNAFFPSKEGLCSEERTEIQNYYNPKPGGGCKHLTTIQSTGSTSVRRGAYGVTFIFVQGKESASIVTRDLGNGKEIHDLQLDFICMADPRLGMSTTFIGGPVFEQPVELYPYAAVSAILSPDDLNEEKGSKPPSHKESSSRPLNEEAAIKFLEQKLEDDGFKETIQTAISTLQCLYEGNVKADEIQVYTAHVDQTHKFLSREEIEMHLASSST